MDSTGAGPAAFLSAGGRHGNPCCTSCAAAHVQLLQCHYAFLVALLLCKQVVHQLSKGPTQLARCTPTGAHQ